MKKVSDGIRDLSSNSRVDQKLIAEVGRINQRIDFLKKSTGIYAGLKKITYQQLVFMQEYLREGDPEIAAFKANTRITKQASARKWGMRQLENTFIQSTIKKALEGEERLSPAKIANKVADAFDNAATVGDVIKVAEFVTKTRGEYNDGNKIGINVGLGVIGGQSTEELEKQFAILVGGGEDQPIESREDNLLDEITLRDGSETGAAEL